MLKTKSLNKLPKSKEAAIKLNLKIYFDGTTCVKGYEGKVKPYTTYSNGGTTKNQKKISIRKKKTPLATEKNNISLVL